MQTELQSSSVGDCCILSMPSITEFYNSAAVLSFFDWVMLISILLSHSAGYLSAEPPYYDAALNTDV